MFRAPVFFLLYAALAAPSAAAGTALDGAEALRRDLRSRLTADELTSLRIPFEADEAIVELATRLTAGAPTDERKLSALRAYFRSQGYLERYDRDGTRSAREALATGEGNCLSFANLFVAMARAAGLRAHYLDASDVIRGGIDRAGSVLVDYGHILVGVRLGPEVVAVEFDGRARSPRRFTPLSDRDATADFYNNLGFEAAWRHPERGAFASAEARSAFELASRISPRFSRSWNNLGVALARAGRPLEAERAYRHAIRLRPDFAAALANLGALQVRQGRAREAVACLERAVASDSDNAHYRYLLGRAHLALGQEAEALATFETAVALEPKLFLAEMKVAALQARRGQTEAAAAAARRVLEIVPHHRDATRLLHRLDPLTGRNHYN